MTDEHEKLLRAARDVTGLKLVNGPYTDTELQHVIDDYRVAQRKRNAEAKEKKS